MSGSTADVASTRGAHRRGERVTVAVGAMVHGGVCLGHLDDGTTLLVDGAIPLETVEAELTFRKGGVWFARTVAVVDASPDRVTAPCPYYGECGGCQLQHVGAARQLDLKREIVLDAMRRQHVPLPPDVPVHGMADPWRYRWRGEFHAVPGAAGMADARLGFNRVRSWRPVPIDDCLIHHPAITTSLQSLLNLVRDSADKSLTTLHLTAGEDGDELLLRARPRGAVPAAAVDAHALTAERRWTTDATTLRWRGHVFRVTPDTFIQVNWGQLEVLYSTALRGLGDLTGATVVDAYAGVGVLACAMAGDGATVVCIESGPSSARIGALNASLNGCAGAVSYIRDTVESALPAAAARADAVVLDPPRAGCDPRVTAWLALAGPPRIVYVSCDPATLARDLRVLTVSGPYTVTTVDVVDMFPQTHHVETVVALHR